MRISGLLPGALLLNDHQKFACKNTYIISENLSAPITKNIVGQALKIPIAHGEKGRYFADEKTLHDLDQNQQIIFKYCNESGEIGKGKSEWV